MPEQKRKSKKRKHSISFADSPSLTKQSFKDECDVNKIVDRFTRTGQLDHLRPGNPEYGEAPHLDYHTAACIAAETASAEAEGRLDAVTGSDEESEEKPLQDDSDAPSDDKEPVPDPDDGDGTEA